MKEITVPGDPKANKRHRDRAPIMGKNGRSFTPKYDPSSGDKGDFLSQIRTHAPFEPLRGPVQVDVLFAFSRPKSHYGTGSKSNVLKDSAPTFHTSKPDRDNLDKLILDSMSKIFWHDDCQICDGQLKKIYSEHPRTVIRITEL